MAAAVGLTDAKIKGLKAPEKGQAEFSDAIVPGLRVRIGKSGKPAFIVRKRVGQRVVNLALGQFNERHFPLAAARKKAREALEALEAGDDVAALLKPQEVVADKTFREVSEDFIERHVDRNKLRSAAEVKRIFKTYLWPEWGHMSFLSVRRRSVTELLDKIEDGKAGELSNLGGPVQADRVLAALSKLFTWYASRDEDYLSPIVRGMSRTQPAQRARKRVIGMTVDGEINDDEIRLFWRAAGESGGYGAFLQLCLLTVQRRAKVVAMQRSHLSAKGLWIIDGEAREKSNARALQLTPMALAIIDARPEIEDNPYVFAGTGGKPMYPGDKLKKDFEIKLAEANGGKPLPHWTIHDLRRTGKTLMRRAGVDSEVTERVLGHAIAGVEGIYDRHDYAKEKAAALAKLEGLLKLILEPAKNVAPLKGKRKAVK